MNASVEWRGRGTIPLLQQCQVLRADDRDLSNLLVGVSSCDTVEHMLELLQKALTFNITHNTGIKLSSQPERIVLMDTGNYRERVRETRGRRVGRKERMGRFLHRESHTTTVREFLQKRLACRLGKTGCFGAVATDCRQDTADGIIW